MWVYGRGFDTMGIKNGYFASLEIAGESVVCFRIIFLVVVVKMLL
jgi:hypothetical protein